MYRETERYIHVYIYIYICIYEYTCNYMYICVYIVTLIATMDCLEPVVPSTYHGAHGSAL